MTTDILLSAGNLPAEPNSFVGRERDLAELALLLTDVRALTLCGPGGIGKTRLALRLAAELSPDYPDGTWLAELADLGDPDLVTRRVAHTLGIREEPDRSLAETLADALRSRHLLLILDTCEHLVDACATLVQQLLAGCRWVRVIATSREPLRVRGEQVWRVPPLELPASLENMPAEEMLEYEAVRLFTDRAAAVRPGFALSAENAEPVARLCRMLDGIPLAIELAAARIRALSVEQIADRLSDRFQLLASGDRTAPVRQQTLRAAVDWSYELLTGEEQALLRRLSVFSGWNLEMAEQVCADEQIPADDVLDLLAALIDKSLVSLDGEVTGDARYRLLDTIGEYAASRLAASGEREVIRAAHRDYLIRLADSIVSRAFLSGDPPWRERVAMYHRIDVERANYRAALAECLERGDASRGLRLCVALRSPWVSYGDVSEGVGWFDKFLALDADVPPRVQARAQVCRGELAFEQQDYATAGRCAKAGLEIFHSTDGPREAAEAGALRLLGLVSMRAGQVDAALASVVASVAAARAARDNWEEGLALAVRATVIARQGQLAEAQHAFEEALEVIRHNNGWGVAQTLYGFGTLARQRGDNAAALQHFRSALALYQEIDARPEIARCLAGIGWVAMAQLDLDLAARSLAESLQLSLATGQRLAIARGVEAFAALAVIRDDLPAAVKLAAAGAGLRSAISQGSVRAVGSRAEALLESARQRLGPPAVSALVAEGRAMTAHEAVTFALRLRARTDGPAATANGHAGRDGQHGQPDARPPSTGTAGTRVAVPGQGGPGPANARPDGARAGGARAHGAAPAGAGPDHAGSDRAGPAGVSAHDTGGWHADGPGPGVYGQSGPGGGPFVSGTFAAGTEGLGAGTAGARPGNGQAGSRPGPAPPSVLTSRELQIAELIARGLSNRGIAAELTISPATAARHVANIFGKLGFTSRAQVAAWAAERESRRRGSASQDITGPGTTR